MARTLRIVNRTRDKVLAERARIADNILTRVLGLMGRRGLAPGAGLVIKPCNSIHSMWMRFQFDAVFLDGDLHVVHLIGRMKPWRMSPMVWKARSIVELPAGVIEESGTEVGDEVELGVSNPGTN